MVRLYPRAQNTPLAQGVSTSRHHPQPARPIHQVLAAHQHRQRRRRLGWQHPALPGDLFHPGTVTQNPLPQFPHCQRIPRAKLARVVA